MRASGVKGGRDGDALGGTGFARSKKRGVAWGREAGASKNSPRHFHVEMREDIKTQNNKTGNLAWRGPFSHVQLVLHVSHGLVARAAERLLQLRIRSALGASPIRWLSSASRMALSERRGG